MRIKNKKKAKLNYSADVNKPAVTVTAATATATRVTAATATVATAVGAFFFLKCARAEQGGLLDGDK